MTAFRRRAKWRSRLALSLVDDSTSTTEVPPKPKRLTAPRKPKAPCPDLLHAEPKMTIDEDLLLPQLAFAFAGGDASDTIKHYLSDICVEKSDWDPSSFAKHLFVDNLIPVACVPQIDGLPADIDTKALRIRFTNPPADPATVERRRSILAVLADDEAHAQALEELYRRLARLRRLFLVSAHEGRDELSWRRLDTLAAFRAVVEHLADSFDGAGEGLEQARGVAIEVSESPGFKRLCDLLDHDRNLATVDLSLQLGASGRLRRFHVGTITENKGSEFYEPPLSRMFTRFRLWLRGYRFSESEIVDRWTDSVYADIEPLMPGFLQLVGQVEFYLAALAFRAFCKGKGLEVSLPELVDEGTNHLEDLFNPLLFAQGVTPVPCSIESRGPGAITLVTGPNSGGKTRLLQALGLTQMLAQVGFFVPAAKAKIRRVPGIFCSLVQEEAFDQAEGRLGSELLRIRQLFERAKPGSLVILDELCSGTNPSEGEKIFMLVIELLRELGPETFVTTHFLGFAKRLEDEAERLGLSFLQVELDDTEHPTYGFVPGVATTSLAAQAAARLGVTREELLALVRRQS